MYRQYKYIYIYIYYMYIYDVGIDSPDLELQLPATRLAARAILVYLTCFLDAKAAGTPRPLASLETASSAKGRAEAEALLREGSPGFDAFFTALQAIFSPPTLAPLNEFKREVVRTLFPMAPYLAGL